MKTKLWDKTKNKDFMKTAGFHVKTTAFNENRNERPGMVTPCLSLFTEISVMMYFNTYYTCYSTTVTNKTGINTNV